MQSCAIAVPVSLAGLLSPVLVVFILVAIFVSGVRMRQSQQCPLSIARSHAPEGDVVVRLVDARVSSRHLDALVGSIDCVAVGRDGTLFICAGSAVYASTPTHTRLLAGHVREKGLRDGEGEQARFSTAFGAAVDNEGNIIIADTKNHCIRKVASSSGNVETLAGGGGRGERGYRDGYGVDARFDRPHGVAVDQHGVIYVCDTNNHVVRKLELTAGACMVSTLAGNREASKAFDPGQWKMDGVGADVTFSFPRGLALDVDSTLIVADCR